MNVKIITPDKILFEGTAKLLQLPGTGGLFEILNGHAPIIASLKEGSIKLEEEEGEKRFEIKAVVFKGQKDEILVLVQ